MCSLKTMVKILLGIALILIAGYFAFPVLRPIIISLAPFAILAICPISMLFGMSMMNNNQHTGCHGDNKPQKEGKLN